MHICQCECICRQHITDIGLEDMYASKNENLGFIRLSLMVSPVTEKEATTYLLEHQLVAGKKSNKSGGNCKVWNSILTVTLMEANNLPTLELNGIMQSILDNPFTLC